MNAATSADATFYFYSLPSNKLELWMSPESEKIFRSRLQNFTKEKQVILEETPLAHRQPPSGKMIEEFSQTAFQVHPYRHPIIGFIPNTPKVSPEKTSTNFSIPITFLGTSRALSGR